MQKLILIISIFLVSSCLYAQEKGDLIDDRWNELQECLEKNTFEIIENIDTLESELMENLSLNENGYLIIIGNSYKNIIIQMMKKAIDSTYKKLPVITKKVNDNWLVSSHLENLFFGHFDKEYVNNFKLKPCRQTAQGNLYTDYFKILD